MSHPGLELKNTLTELGVSRSEAKMALGLSDSHLSELLNGKRGVSPKLALKIEALTGQDALMWLMLQAEYDLEVLRK